MNLSILFHNVSQSSHFVQLHVTRGKVQSHFLMTLYYFVFAIYLL